MKTLEKSFVVEAALAAMFAAAFVMPAAAQDAPKGDGTGAPPAPTKKAPSKKASNKVHCFGINSCKGKSECAVDGKSSCKGKNSCKNMGWISVTAKKCAAKKGTVAPEAAPAPAPAPAAH
jgi:hypothetical protein